MSDERRRRGNVLVTPAVQMTAAASGSSGITVPNNAQANFGTGNFSIVVDTALPDYSPSGGALLYYKFQDSNNRLYWAVTITGTFNLFAVVGGVVIFDVTSTETIESAGYAAWNSLEFGASVTRETASAAGSVIFTVNGQQLGSARPITAAATVSIDNTGPVYVNGTASVRNESITRQWLTYNRALSAAEVLSLRTTGIASGDRWGSNVELVTNSDFSAGSTGWTVTGADATHIVTFSGGTMRYQSDTTSPVLNVSNAAADVVIGELYNFEIVVSSYTSGAVKSDHFSTIIASAGTHRFTAVATKTGKVVIYRNSSNVDMTFDSISVKAAGATAAYLPETLPTSGALEWPDSSDGNNDATLPAAGATKVTIRA